MIPANDFRRQWEEIGPDVLKAVSRTGESGWYVLGSEVRNFESVLARVWGLPFATGVASGLDAIEISLRVLGAKAGDRVITTPVSAFATTLAIVKLGAVPVFIDCDDNGLIRLDLVEKWLDTHPGVCYFVPVHLYGLPLDLDQLGRLKDRFELRIVEDCAQSVLASWRGRPTGSVGQMAATSFYPTKNLGAMGDGGAILTADSRYAAAAACYRDYGQTAKYRHGLIGYNSRLDELHAAILKDAMLPRLSRWTGRRREISQAYCTGIRNPLIRVPQPVEGRGSGHHLFPVFVDPHRKPAFLDLLRRRGIASGEHYPLCIFEQEALRDVPHEVVEGCENARKLCRSEISLPLHPYLTEEEAAAVVSACNDWTG
jgi:dTDP-3-amino-3,4,6-trideoxy-alpha-D-glucose transaminase